MFGRQNSPVVFLRFPLMVDRAEGSSSQVVAMMQAAEPRHGDDPRIRRSSRSCRSPRRRLLTQSEMSAVSVVVADVFLHKPHQMALVRHAHVIEQIATAAADCFQTSFKSRSEPRTESARHSARFPVKGALTVDEIVAAKASKSSAEP